MHIKPLKETKETTIPWSRKPKLLSHVHLLILNKNVFSEQQTRMNCPHPFSNLEERQRIELLVNCSPHLSCTNNKETWDV